ncbi:hypothetical protein HD806DRAFT_512838 [Xylariaceae sp. AK1471]|nr:hypothetical protein HD806DRAFT_512838 [Xylariaceae sp. AK1471]
MRLASRALRNVQLKRPIPPSRVSLLLLYSQPCASDIRHFAVPPRHGIRPYSIALSPSSAADSDLILTELSHTSRAPSETRVDLQQPADGSLILETKAFKKWSALVTNPARLLVETDFFRQGPAKEWRSRLLVDKFENHGDLALWSCLLDYQMRINGSAGVLHVWRGLWGRKALYDVDSPLAKMFWRVMLEGALTSDDSSVLDHIWIYSEWMYDLHQVKWPQLYNTIIKHLLRTHQHQRVIQWQLRLTPNFYPGPDEFAKMIKQFATDKELYRVDTLMSLYKVNPDHNLYNTLLPYLFELGESQLAKKWRRVCIRHDDLPLAPTPAPVRPLLRFIEGYHPNDSLVPEEVAALKYISDPAKDEKPDLSREFMNRVHGRTFGITVKNYNDRLGAKWFASSWVSLDMAMSAVCALGIEKIGPLSLQSIALRAGTSEEVLNRISQLQENGISVIDSNYFHIVFHLAKQKDDELLHDLLQSDLHPDVFDDLDLQTRLINSATDISDWRTFRLLLVARLVAFERSARAAANSILQVRFLKRDQDGVLQMLEDMHARNIPLNHEQANYMFESLIGDYRHDEKGLQSQPALFYLSVFRQLKSMDVPVPLSHWRLLMLNMARQGHLDDLERLCVELVDLFLRSPSSRPGFVPVHIGDLPEVMRGPLGSVENLLGVYIPQDLPMRHGLHPLRCLFNSKMITEMIENAFIAHPGQGFRTAHGAPPQGRQPQAAQICAMVRLLRVLHDRGLWFRFRKIVFVLTNCLITLYGRATPSENSRRMMKASNILTLKEMKTLIDRAWGGKLLPPMEELAAVVKKRPAGATLDTRPAEFTEAKEEVKPRTTKQSNSFQARPS